MSVDTHFEKEGGTTPLSNMWDNIQEWGSHPEANAVPRHSYPSGWSPEYTPDAIETPSKKSGKSWLDKVFAWALKK